MLKRMKRLAASTDQQPGIWPVSLKHYSIAINAFDLRG
jgi:hypothetical protein